MCLNLPDEQLPFNLRSQNDPSRRRIAAIRAGQEDLRGDAAVVQEFMLQRLCDLGFPRHQAKSSRTLH